MRLDIVIPAHNEEHRIDPTLRSYRAGFPNPEVRLIVALDSCQDSTAAVVERHIRDDPRVELRVYPKMGKGGVIQETFRHCRGDLVAFVDADGATPPAELARLVDSASHAAGAIASRRHPASVIEGRRPRARTMASATFAWLVRQLFRLPYRDTQCGAKVIRRDVLQRILPLLTTSNYAFDVDLLMVAHRLGYRLVEVPTVWIERPGSRVRLTRDAWQAARSLVDLWIDHRLRPVNVAGVVGEPLARRRGAA